MADQAMPAHVGLILDGNRRWARLHGVPIAEGHRAGYETLKETARGILQRGVTYLTAYAFSRENWSRSKQEVELLLKLALRLVTSDIEELHRKNIRVRFLGSTDGLDAKLIRTIKVAEAKTASNSGGTLGLCFNYSGREEIEAAVAAVQASGLPANEASVARHLYAPEIPDLDIIIRTSGEQRLSNFMLWRAAYAELFFTKTLWPDFTLDEFDGIVKEYDSRKRRFGV